MPLKLFSGTPLSQFAEQIERTAPRATRTADARIKAALAQAADPVAPVETAPASAPARQRAPVPLPAQPPAPLRIVPIPRLALGGRWRVEAMRSLSEPLLLWFTRGQGRITVGGVTRGYGVHNAVFIPAGVMHGFEVGPQTFGLAVFFGQSHGLALPDGPHHLRIRDTAPQAELTGLLDNIQRELESSRPGHDRAARLHLGLLAVWLERQIELAQAEPHRAGAALRLARRYAEALERDFATGKGVGDYARELGVTPTHLSRVCNQTCGRSASDLLHDRIIFEARRLLSETKLPVGQISEALGFTSPAYFTRAFQHRTGKTPSAFRKQG
ncbi:MAG: AraC family transcriptional regulator [Rhodobacteraceae bacterium]|nr:AraC family transcriptional regulator [Paracoccaceae bacterium]